MSSLRRNTETNLQEQIVVKLQIIFGGLVITWVIQNSSLTRMPVDALAADTIKKCNLACFP